MTAPDAIIMTMSKKEARACVDEINSHVGKAREMLLDLYERKGWQALGYKTWRECVEREFEQSQAYLYRQLEAAQIEKNIFSPIGENRESHLRPLSAIPAGEQMKVWQQVVDTAPLGLVTAAHVQEVVDEYKNPFNYKRDTKKAVAQDIYTPQGMDACQTPAYAIDPLLPYLTQFNTIWEPASGEGNLVDAFLDVTPHNFNVIGSDIITGQNFFDFEPDMWDCIVTNPPFSIKFQWLARCYTLGKPFALLMPVETLGTKTAQELFEKYGMEVILLDKRVNFKMPNKGWDAGGAQFPTAWFTWQMNLPTQIHYGKISHD